MTLFHRMFYAYVLHWQMVMDVGKTGIFCFYPLGNITLRPLFYESNEKHGIQRSIFKSELVCTEISIASYSIS